MIYKFSSLALAQSFANRATKLMLVLQGDDDKFWVSTSAVTERLNREGYEYA